jgi:hypothetical protein
MLWKTRNYISRTFFKLFLYILNFAATPLRLWSTEQLPSNIRFKRITQFLKGELQILKSCVQYLRISTTLILINFLYKQHTIVYPVT